MVAEEVIISLAGGAPWGFRLQGGVEQEKPLQVAKVRKRSKACRAGLREADELVSINEQPCATLSHGQAMDLIDGSSGILHIRVKRAPPGFQSVVLVARAPSPRIDKEYRATLRAMSPSKPQHAPVREVHCSRSSLTSGLTSPPGSEAYYAETDSDADVAGYERQRRQKRRSPSNSTPGKPGRNSPEGGETSEMSGYDSAPDAQVYPGLLEGRAGGDDEGGLPGVARREVIYQPPAPGLWSSQTSTETSSIISSADDQGPRDGAQEEDSGFLEPANVPLVSPERAKEALLLGSRDQLIPMVGPVNKPVDEELTTTYMEKAKQAKLNRGDTVQDKQVKEAKSKCRTIASLLTDAPNPHSKGVLMFKKRRQRSKKYTLTSFGSVDEDRYQDSQEEDGLLPGSESEFDEDGFSSVPDPTWDSDYLDMLEKRATAGSEGRGDGLEDAPSPGLSNTAGKGAQLFEQQRKRAAEHAKKVEAAQPHPPPQSQVVEHSHVQVNMPIQATAAPIAPQQEAQPSAPQAMPAGDSAAITSSMVMSPVDMALASAPIVTSPAPPSETLLPDLPASNVLNRTARPFTPGFISVRAATAPVAFRPSVTKTTPRPASAAVAQQFTTAPEQISKASFAMAPLPADSPVVPAATSIVPQNPYAPTFEAPAAPLPPATIPEVPQAAPPVTSVQGPFLSVSSGPTPLFPLTAGSPSPNVPIAPSPAAPVSAQIAPLSPVLAAASQPCQYSMGPAAPVSVPEPQATTATPSGPGSRTGILLEARRRSGKPKPMFNLPELRKNSPNPELLSMVQNLDDRFSRQRGSTQSNEVYYGGAEEECAEDSMGRMPPPVAPKPRLIHEVPQMLQAEGKGAQLFARRQNRMGMYVVDNPSEPAYPREISQNPSISSQWKYSPNIRAPPPIGYNPLLGPSIPTGPQRDVRKTQDRGTGGTQKEGIKALDFMKRQPYQLNPAMFSYGGSVANVSAMPSYQAQDQGHYTAMVGSSLTPPKQIPVKTARVLEIRRFSTPTPMSAPTLTPKVIAPRSATSLGERLSHSDMTSPPPPAFTTPLDPLPAEMAPPTAPAPTTALPLSHPTGLPSLPTFSSVPNPVPTAAPPPYTPASYSTGLYTAKQFQSAPELSILSSLPSLKSNPIQVPKPRFVATKGGIQPRVWRPGGQFEQ